MTSEESGAVDLSVLAAMVGEEPAALRLWLNRFLDRAAVTVAEIDIAHAQGDVAQVGALGHRLKSPARSVGAAPFGDLCQALEEAGRAGDGRRVGELVPRLAPLLEELSRFTETL